jgi:hypothetical protein
VHQPHVNTEAELGQLYEQPHTARERHLGLMFRAGSAGVEGAEGQGQRVNPDAPEEDGDDDR